MKKILFGILLCLFIVGCGKDYETYTKAEKIKMYNLALEEQDNGNNKEMEKIKELINKLELAYKDGDSSAKIEWREWREIIVANDGLYRNYKPGDSKVDMTNRAW